MRCGPFELLEPLASGGSGRVWRARHGDTPVAVKLVPVPDLQARQIFEREVRSLAALQHPHILTVFDQGTLDRDLAAGLPAGTPWMALEMASGGDLRRIWRDLDWKGVRAVLLTVLDALAHAHAHGIVHRDLKPANILLADADDLRPGLKLADFGIALSGQAPRIELRDDEVAGTPTSISPEQLMGAFRQTGPWTDLYAVGCLTWRMVTGRYPFSHKSGSAALFAHLNSPPPPFVPRMEVPTGLEAWVRRLLEKEPRDRYPFVADAIHALSALPEVPSTQTLPLPVQRSHVVVRHWTRTAWGDPLEPAQPPPMAKTWRRPASPTPPLPLVDAGLALFPLRRARLIGRDASLDALWSALHDVREHRRARAIVIRGESGVGSTRLADAFVRRAHALGAALPFRARGEAAATFSPVLLTLARSLRVEGLAGPDIAEAIRENLELWGPPDPDRAEHLTRLVDGRVADTTAHHAALLQVMRERAGERAAILSITDAGSCTEAVDLAAGIQGTPDLPILVVVDAGEADSEALRELEALERTEVVRLGRLNRREASQVLGSRIPMAPSTVAPILDEAAGLPGVLAHRLDDLVRRGALQQGVAGFSVAPASVGGGSLGTLEDARFDRLWESLDASARRSLVFAATWGDEVDMADWGASTDGQLQGRQIALRPTLERMALLDRLVREGLATETRMGWHFEARSRERVLGRASPEVRAGAASVVADCLLSNAGRHVPHLRIARLLGTAGRLEEALAHYHPALVDTNPTVPIRFMDGAAMCAEALRIADALGLPEDDEARETLLCRQLQLEEEAALDHVVDRAEALEAKALRHGWNRARCVSHALRARRSVASADDTGFDHHVDAVRRALLHLPTLDLVVAFSVIDLATTLQLRGRLAEALELVHHALEYAHESGSTRILALAASREATIRSSMGESLDPVELSDQASLFEDLGYLFASGCLLLIAGDQQRRVGRLERSEALNLRAGRCMDRLGLEEPAVPFNLAINAFLREDADAMRDHIDAGQAMHIGREFWTLANAVLDVAWASLLAEPGTASDRVDRCEHLARGTRRVLDPDEVFLLEAAAGRLALLAPPLADRIRRIIASRTS